MAAVEYIPLPWIGPGCSYIRRGEAAAVVAGNHAIAYFRWLGGSKRPGDIGAPPHDVDTPSSFFLSLFSKIKIKIIVIEFSPLLSLPAVPANAVRGKGNPVVEVKQVDLSFLRPSFRFRSFLPFVR